MRETIKIVLLLWKTTTIERNALLLARKQQQQQCTRTKNQIWFILRYLFFIRFTVDFRCTQHSKLRFICVSLWLHAGAVLFVVVLFFHRSSLEKRREETNNLIKFSEEQQKLYIHPKKNDLKTRKKNTFRNNKSEDFCLHWVTMLLTSCRVDSWVHHIVLQCSLSFCCYKRAEP